MPQRIRQIAAMFQVIALLLAGGFAEGLHVLPGLGHGGHGCCDHHEAQHRCDHHDHKDLSHAIASEEHGAKSELVALHECAICKLLASWRRVDLTAPLKVDASPESAACIPCELQQLHCVSTHCAKSRGPPALL
ncbi:hypothetical protein [Blastopirellula marina]|nr:hypothetical protein [Blastopirellula marina]